MLFFLEEGPQNQSHIGRQIRRLQVNYKDILFLFLQICQFGNVSWEVTMWLLKPKANCSFFFFLPPPLLFVVTIPPHFLILESLSSGHLPLFSPCRHRVEFCEAAETSRYILSTYHKQQSVAQRWRGGGELAASLPKVAAASTGARALLQWQSRCRRCRRRASRRVARLPAFLSPRRPQLTLAVFLSSYNLSWYWLVRSFIYEFNVIVKKWKEPYGFVFCFVFFKSWVYLLFGWCVNAAWGRLEEEKKKRFLSDRFFLCVLLWIIQAIVSRWVFILYLFHYK